MVSWKRLPHSLAPGTGEALRSLQGYCRYLRLAIRMEEDFFAHDAGLISAPKLSAAVIIELRKDSSLPLSGLFLRGREVLDRIRSVYLDLSRKVCFWSLFLCTDTPPFVQHGTLLLLRRTTDLRCITRSPLQMPQLQLVRALADGSAHQKCR